MSELLSVGVIKEMFEAVSEDGPRPENPVLQVVRFSNQNNPNESPQSSRVRVAFSDGQELVSGIIPVNLLRSISGGKLERGQLLRLTHYSCNISQSTKGQQPQKVIVVSSYEVANSELQPIIGNPFPGQDTVTERSRPLAQPNQPSAPPNPQLSQQLTPTFPRSVPGVQQQMRPPTPTFNGGGIMRSSSNDMRRSSSGSAEEGIFPINLLSPYHNKWKIRAVVGAKSDIKHWQNQNGTGKLFNCTLLDESGEIRATAFGQQVDAFYDKLEEGKTYLISKAKVNVAKKNFSPVKNDYEIYLESATIIEEVANKNPTDLIKFDFVRIDNITQYEKDSTIDVIGIVINVDDIQPVMTRTTQRNINKRDLTIADQSEFQITLTLWGQNAEKYGTSILNTVIACKNVRVGDFQGRNLSAFNGTTLLTDVDLKEAKELLDWHSSQEEGKTFTSLSSSGSVTIDRNEPKKSLAQVKNEKLGSGERADYFSTKATVLFIKKENICYPACPTCKKKVLEDGDEYRCEKCSRNYPAPDHRYIMTFSVADFSDNAWFQCFNEGGLVIMEREAKDMIQFSKENTELYEECIEQACLKSYEFRCRAKTENYNEQIRIRYTVTGIAPIDYVERTRDLHQAICQMEQ
ncbi:hypothetical protein C2G38_2118650 [Gigaspora rosea]|uniref:Replication protein A subunit n=1 Tax=Gigaspora rosea TaxID=44941 RepID=A0A397U9A6_9GLOM|nr:hypothetical protein C2G38_2118650 [Gigaspora rosea]